MIKNYYISNDKSSAQLLPGNFKSWLNSKNELCAEITPISKIFNHFTVYMQDKCERYINITNKYKVEFYFKYFQITQYRRVPFTIYINFNYIQYKNQSGFNYIREDTEFYELREFLENIKDFYLNFLTNFIDLFEDKYDRLKDSKNIFFKDQYDRNVINIFKRHLLYEYMNSREFKYTNISVTCDFHFENPMYKNMYFSVIQLLQKDQYKNMRIDDETVFMAPFNHSLQIPNKNLPKIRFYDKQKDTIFRYYRKKRGISKGFDNSSIEDLSMTERFDLLNVYSQESKELEIDFIDALGFLRNCLRFELEFPKSSLKKIFGNTNIYSLTIDNHQIIFDYLIDLLDSQYTSFTETKFYDQVTKEKEIIVYDKIYFDEIGCTGDVTEKFNFICKHSSFLNRVRNLRCYPHNKKDCESGLSQNALYSKIKRFKKQGVLRGHGQNISLNQPYLALLGIYNHYYVYNLIRKRGAGKTATARAPPVAVASLP